MSIYASVTEFYSNRYYKILLVQCINNKLETVKLGEEFYNFNYNFNYNLNYKKGKVCAYKVHLLYVSLQQMSTHRVSVQEGVNKTRIKVTRTARIGENARLPSVSFVGGCLCGNRSISLARLSVNIIT